MTCLISSIARSTRATTTMGEASAGERTDAHLPKPNTSRGRLQTERFVPTEIENAIAETAKITRQMQ